MRIVSKPRELGDADFALVRKGLRRTSVDRAKVLQWMSYGMWRTVPGKENMPFAPRQPQAAAVEIMYHAADPKPEADRYGTRYNAVYFGLSQVQPKPPNVLHALADLAMTTEDSQLLGRIVASLTWGPSQQEAFLEFIKSYEQSREPRARDEAALLRKIVNQEEEPAVLAVRRDRARAKARFGDRLPAIEATLRSGSPADRLETLRLIRKERIFWIMEDSSIPAFALAATDRDPEVRKAVAEVVGLRFLWNESPSPEAAIDLVMRMSFNEELPVRRSVVRYGLAPLKGKPERVIRRLLEMAEADRDPDLRAMVEGGLRADWRTAARILRETIAAGGPRADEARAIYPDLALRPLPDPDRVVLPRSPRAGKPRTANFPGIARTPTTRPTSTPSSPTTPRAAGVWMRSGRRRTATPARMKRC